MKKTVRVARCRERRTSDIDGLLSFTVKMVEWIL